MVKRVVTLWTVLAEYGMGGEASKEGDVYSFGLFLLEMFTGKGPTHEMFKDGLNLHHYARNALPQNLIHIVSILLEREEQEMAANSHRAEIQLGGGNDSMNQRQTQINAKLHKCL